MSTADFIIPRARENATAIDMLARDIQRRVAENVREGATSGAGALHNPAAGTGLAPLAESGAAGSE